MARRQSGRMEEKICLCLTWPAMTARVTPSRWKVSMRLRELAEGEPVDVDVGVGGGAGVDLGVGLFFDGGDDYGETVSAGGVEEEEREAAVAGDESEFSLCRHERFFARVEIHNF